MDEQNIPNGTYYFTNYCNYSGTPEMNNPKYLLITWKSVKELRRHLQNHLIADIAGHDQWTMEGNSIHTAFIPMNGSASNRTVNIITKPTSAPSITPTAAHFCSQLLQKTENEKIDENDDELVFEILDEMNDEHIPSSSHYSDEDSTIFYSNSSDIESNSYSSHSTSMKNDSSHEYGIHVFNQYRKNAFQMYSPNGRSLSWTEKIEDIPPIMFLYEGGRWIWPGIHKHHEIRIPIGPNIKLKTLNMRPLIFEVSGLISDGELDYLRNQSSPYLHRSEVGLNENKRMSKSRTCSSVWLFGKHDLLVNSLKARVSEILLIPKSHLEDMEIVKYESGQRFDIHFDAFQQTSDDSHSPQSQILLHGGFKNRIATVFYYLNDIQEMDGGSTVFPRSDSIFIPNTNEANADFDANNNWSLFLNDEKSGGMSSTPKERAIFDNDCKISSSGFKIEPGKGKVLLWYNMDSAGNLDPLALHGGCTVNRGTKWISNQWVWNRSFNY